jgi:energy-coupling factor transporter ATP-binding protein EcfA2
MGYEKGKIKQNYMTEVPKEKLTDVAKLPFKEIKERGIRKETCERFGVRCATSPQEGPDVPIAYYFPSYNQKGKVVGYMKQDITKDKSEAGHWTAIGSVSINNKLFGQDVAESVKRKRKNLIATEGQIDTMSAYQAATDKVKGTQYDGMEPFIVSIPLGTANAVEAMLHNQEFVKSFESLSTFFDNDESTPAETKKGIMKGREATEAVMAAFVGSGINLFTIEADDGFKDASDYLQADKGDELANLVSFGKKIYTPEKIIHVSDISVEQVMAPAPEGVMVNQFPKLMDKTYGFHKRALTLVTAPSGAGKTTAVSIVSNAIIECGMKPGLIYLEETAVETVQRMVSEELKVNFLKFKRKPLAVATEEAIRAAYAKVNAKNPALLDHFGSIKIDSLMGKIKYMHEIEKCDFIILDHISMTISGLEVTDERKELDVAMTEIAAYCASHDVGIIVVCHLNRGGTADQFKVKKGDEDKPYWVRVTKESLRGSASLEQLSMVILALEPEILPSRERGRVRWVVLKNRPLGYLGEADIFKLNEQTWEVELSELEEF